MKLIIGALLLLVILNVNAETELFYGYKSHHWVTEDHTNNEHHLLGVRHGIAVAGHFKNSYGRDTVFIGFYKDWTWKEVEIFGAVGAMRGYTTCYGEDGSNKNICPMFTGGLSYTGISNHFKPTVFQLGDATVIGFRSEF